MSYPSLTNRALDAAMAQEGLNRAHVIQPRANDRQVRVALAERFAHGTFVPRRGCSLGRVTHYTLVAPLPIDTSTTRDGKRSKLGSYSSGPRRSVGLLGGILRRYAVLTLPSSAWVVSIRPVRLRRTICSWNVSNFPASSGSFEEIRLALFQRGSL
jgi:hypothetical protein